MIQLLISPALALVLSMPLTTPPDTIAPGAHALDRAVMVESVATLDNFGMRDSVQVKGGTMTTTTRPVPGVWDQWAIVSRWTSATGAPTSLDSIIVATHPLRAVRHRVQSAADSAEIVYVGDHVSGWVEPGHGKPRKTIDATLAHGAFPDGLREQVIAWLPLHNGFAGELRAFDAWSGSAGAERLIGVHVTGADTLAAQGEKVLCWKVTVDRRDPSGIVHTLWIAKNNRRLLRSESRNATGKLLWFDVAR